MENPTLTLPSPWKGEGFGGGSVDDSPITQLVGRTPCDRIVVFKGNRRQIGQLLPVVIYDCTPMTLFGAVVTRELGPEVYSLA